MRILGYKTWLSSRPPDPTYRLQTFYLSDLRLGNRPKEQHDTAHETKTLSRLLENDVKRYWHRDFKFLGWKWLLSYCYKYAWCLSKIKLIHWVSQCRSVAVLQCRSEQWAVQNGALLCTWFRDCDNMLYSYCQLLYFISVCLYFIEIEVFFSFWLILSTTTKMSVIPLWLSTRNIPTLLSIVNHVPWR